MRRTLLAALTATLLATALPAWATLDTAPTARAVPSGHDRLDAVPLLLVGFDRSIAAANGFAVVEFDDGSQASIPTGFLGSVTDATEAVRVGAAVVFAHTPGSSLTGAATQSEIIAGNCGLSWFYLDTFRRQYRVSTGFTINSDWAPAVAYRWVTWVDGPGWANEWRTFVGALRFERSWQTWWLRRDRPPGWYAGEVVSGTVVLSDGSICVSGGPSSSGRVTR